MWALGAMEREKPGTISLFPCTEWRPPRCTPEGSRVELVPKWWDPASQVPVMWAAVIENTLALCVFPPELAKKHVTSRAT